MQALAIHVGANRTFPGFRGSIRPDGTFTYVPPPETDPALEGPTYADLDLDVPVPEEHEHTPVHLDPEFPDYPYGQAFTYGVSATATSGALRELLAGDVVFFYATLDYEGEVEPELATINPYWGAYLIGHFELARDPLTGAEVLDLPAEELAPIDNNAHFRRPTFDAEVVVLGHPERSELYEHAIPLSSNEDPSRPNRIVTELSQDSGEPGWHRRLLAFDEAATHTLLAGIENDDVTRLIEPEASPPRADGQAYLVLDEAPGAHPFQRFLALDTELFGLDTWIDHHIETDDPAAPLFASIAFVAGGWSTELLTALWEGSIRDLATAAELEDQVQAVLAEAIAETDGGWPHPRRGHLPEHPDKAGARIAAALTCFHKEVEDLAGQLFAASPSADPYPVSSRMIQEVPTYDPATALDQLHVWHDVLSRPEAGPRRLRPIYVQAPDPARGFEAIFARPLVEMETHEAQACLDALVRRAETTLSCSRARAVFRVEDALRRF